MCELGARHFYAGQFNPLQTDSILNHVWIPNQVQTTASYANRGVPPYTRKVNGQGWMMSYDVSPDKPAGVYRVVYLGDSFTEGTCPEEDSVPAIIRTAWQGRGSQEVEVINTGTSSYAPTLYYLLLKTKLLAFKPDLIVVNVDMTDVFDDSLYRATLTTDAEGDPIACAPGHPALATHRRTERGLEELSLLQRFITTTARYSDASRLVIDVVGEMARQRKAPGGHGAPQSFAWCDNTRSQRTQDDVAWSILMLRRIIKLAKDNGIKIVITAVPHREQLEGKWSLEPMNDIAAVCQAEGVPFLNPVEAFKQRLGSTPPADIYIKDDMHFNPKGYRMWGEIQLEFLNQLGLP